MSVKISSFNWSSIIDVNKFFSLNNLSCDVNVPSGRLLNIAAEKRRRRIFLLRLKEFLGVLSKRCGDSLDYEIDKKWCLDWKFAVKFLGSNFLSISRNISSTMKIAHRSVFIHFKFSTKRSWENYLNNNLNWK